MLRGFVPEMRRVVARSAGRRTAAVLGVLILGLAATPASAFWRPGCFIPASINQSFDDVIRHYTYYISGMGRQHIAENLACLHYGRGLAYEFKRDYADAIADYSRALEGMETFPDAYAARGDAYDAIGDHARAAADYAQARALASHDPDELTERCWVRALRGAPLDRALADCNESLTLKPDEFNALTSRCLVYVRMGNSAAAIADCDAALRLTPGNASALFERGLAKLHAGDAAGGNADLAAAKAAQDKTAATFALYGIVP